VNVELSFSAAPGDDAVAVDEFGMSSVERRPAAGPSGLKASFSQSVAPWTVSSFEAWKASRGLPNARAHSFMVAGLALTIGVVLLSILALHQPFAGITRVDPDAFHQVDRIIELWAHGGGP
jgi:hypothetical protein